MKEHKRKVVVQTFLLATISPLPRGSYLINPFNYRRKLSHIDPKYNVSPPKRVQF